MSQSLPAAIDQGESGRASNGVAWQRIDRGTWAFAAAAGAMVIAGGLVAALNSAAPFSHGSWLAAYLVLVGGVAQLLLGVGCLGLPAPSLSVRLRGAQLALWNLGNVAVIAGVLGDAVGLVAAGSVTLLAALGGFAIGAGPAAAPARRRVVLYRLAILGLAISVVIGSFLADASPGS
jgi:hypothetical protein